MQYGHNHKQIGVGIINIGFHKQSSGVPIHPKAVLQVTDNFLRYFFVRADTDSVRIATVSRETSGVWERLDLNAICMGI